MRERAEPSKAVLSLGGLILCAVAQPYRASGVDMLLALQDTLVVPLERVGTAWNDVHRIT
jgi:hypothetical protein